MQAGLTKRVTSLEEIINLVPIEPSKKGDYKKKANW